MNKARQVDSRHGAELLFRIGGGDVAQGRMISNSSGCVFGWGGSPSGVFVVSIEVQAEGGWG